MERLYTSEASSLEERERERGRGRREGGREGGRERARARARGREGARERESECVRESARAIVLDHTCGHLSIRELLKRYLYQVFRLRDGGKDGGREGGWEGRNVLAGDIEGAVAAEEDVDEAPEAPHVRSIRVLLAEERDQRLVSETLRY
jgi:hypothetical protein